MHIIQGGDVSYQDVNAHALMRPVINVVRIRWVSVHDRDVVTAQYIRLDSATNVNQHAVLTDVLSMPDKMAGVTRTMILCMDSPGKKITLLNKHGPILRGLLYGTY